MRTAALLAAALTLVACKRKPRAVECPVARDAEVDAGHRIRTIAEVPPMGASADRREVDVPLAWIHVLMDPMPTGGAPSVVVGADVPCGYRAYWANAERVGDEVRVRLRARWDRETPPPATPAPCPTPTPSVQLVSLSVMRLGTWRVTDAVPRPAGAPPAPVATLHVVRDDSTLAAPAARWFRRCDHDADCEGGAVCARIGAGAACLPPLDPWTWAGRPCVDGATARSVRRVDAPTVAWSACVADCAQGRCPAGMRCDPIGACVPDGNPTPGGDVVSREGAVRHAR